MEGCFGVLFMSLLVLPVCYFIPGNGPNDSYENSLDAMAQVRDRWHRYVVYGTGILGDLAIPMCKVKEPLLL